MGPLLIWLSNLVSFVLHCWRVGMWWVVGTVWVQGARVCAGSEWCVGVPQWYTLGVADGEGGRQDGRACIGLL